MALFSSTDLAELRAFNSDTQTDACRITRPSAPVLDETTFVYTPQPGPEVYAGPCQFKESSDAVMQVVGDGSYPLQLIDCYVDHDAPRIRRGDMLEVTQAEETGLVGRDMVILGVRAQTQPRGRKLTCQFVEASATHDPSS